MARTGIAEELKDIGFIDLVGSAESAFQALELVTAYPDYAVHGYELDVIDFLVKPFDFNRLLKACCKAREFQGLREAFFFVKVDGRHEKILFRELLFVEAADNYVFLHTGERKWMVYDTLKNMETLLPPADFMKVHKSFIVGLDKVTTVEGGMLVVGKASIPVSRGLKDIVLGRLLKR
jgi:DNA-binding LytR/AlgR family response regulator